MTNNFQLPPPSPPPARSFCSSSGLCQSDADGPAGRGGRTGCGRVFGVAVTQQRYRRLLNFCAASLWLNARNVAGLISLRLSSLSLFIWFHSLMRFLCTLAASAWAKAVLATASDYFLPGSDPDIVAVVFVQVCQDTSGKSPVSVSTRACFPLLPDLASLSSLHNNRLGRLRRLSGAESDSVQKHEGP